MPTSQQNLLNIKKNRIGYYPVYWYDHLIDYRRLETKQNINSNFETCLITFLSESEKSNFFPVIRNKNKNKAWNVQSSTFLLLPFKGKRRKNV